MPSLLEFLNKIKCGAVLLDRKQLVLVGHATQELARVGRRPAGCRAA